MQGEYAINEVHEADCLDLLRSLPDASAQLIIADPPYNIGPKFGGGREWEHDDDWYPWCQEWLKECQRVLSDEGNLFVYGIHHYLCYLQVYLYEIGMEYRRQIIWYYENGFSRSRRNLATHYEPILWFSKSSDYYMKEIREPYKSTERLKHPVKMKNGKTWRPHPDGRLAGDVWKFPVLAGRRFRDEKVDHPTQKPLNLTDRIVRHFSEEGGLVVVPFVGSGTECVSAARNGRRYVGSEINADYVALARQRIANAEGEPQLPNL
jgi:DNA modification methylase